MTRVEFSTNPLTDAELAFLRDRLRDPFAFHPFRLEVRRLLSTEEKQSEQLHALTQKIQTLLTAWDASREASNDSRFLSRFVEERQDAEDRRNDAYTVVIAAIEALRPKDTL